MSTPVEQAAAAVAEVFKKQGQAPRYTVWIAEAVIEALGLTEEWGIQFDKFPSDVVLGREENPDGSVTRVMKLDNEDHARNAVDSPAPIGGFNKSVVSRLVGPWRTAQ